MAEGPPRELRPVSDIITDLAASEQDERPHLADSLRGQLFRYHPGCNCPECMRIYLNTPPDDDGRAAA